MLEIIEEVKPQLSQRFKKKDLGPIKHCLGMEINQDLEKGTIEINQSGYVETILRRFGMMDAKTATTPMESELHLSKDKFEFSTVTYFDYRSNRITALLGWMYSS